MDDLRERLNLAIAGTAEARCADDGDGYVDVWVTNIEETADAVLTEIGKTHRLVEHERVGPFRVGIDSDMPEGEIRIVDSDGTVLGSITGIGP
jgi:hypothetical protein